MNINKGFFRIWLLITVVTGVFFGGPAINGYMNMNKYYPLSEQLRADARAILLKPKSEVTPEQEKQAVLNTDLAQKAKIKAHDGFLDYKKFKSYAIYPSIISGIVLLMLSWVIAGFRRPTKERD